MTSELEVLAQDIEEKEPQCGVESQIVNDQDIKILPSESVGQDIKAQPAELKTDEDSKSSLEMRIGQKWMLIAGIILTVFGIGYFLKYSFDKGWVGPAGRVAMAYIWGIVFLIVGSKFIKRNMLRLGLYLDGGGIAVLYSATYAAFQIYHLINQFLAFFIMILITVLAVSLAVLYNSKWLSVLALIGGFLTPLLVSTGKANQMALMGYMTVLNCGLLAVAFNKSWGLLNVLGFFCTYFLFTLWFGEMYNPDRFWPTIIFLNIFYLTYIIAPFAYKIFKKQTEKLKLLSIIFLNSFIAFGYGYFMIKQRFGLEWVGVLAVLYAGIHLKMAQFLHKRELHQIDTFYVVVGKSVLFLIIAIPVIFSKHWITIFWAAQSIIMLWISIKLNNKKFMIASYLLTAIVFVKFLFHDYAFVFNFNSDTCSIYPQYTYIIVERYITIAVVLALLYAFGRIIKKYTDQYLANMLSKAILGKSNISDSTAIFILLGILIFIVLNIETAGAFHDYLPAARFAAISVLWTIFSVALMLKGFKDNISGLRKTSILLFLVTIIKVFLFDMSHVSTPYRILSFMILGVMLVAISYLYHKFKDRVIEAMLGEARKRKGL